MITRLDIAPSFYAGFTFMWTVNTAAAPAQPWSFVVQQSPTGVGTDTTWFDISPVLVNKHSYIEQIRKFNKDPNLFFRVRCVAGGKTYYSPVIDAYGELNRNEYILAKEMMRKRQLAFSRLEGVSIQIWKKMQRGVPCPRCLDPVTAEVRDSSCEVCAGTGWVVGFDGPYPGCAKFSTTATHKKFADNAEGVDDDRLHKVELLGFPRLIRDDVITECKSDRRYTVDIIERMVEIRRIPIIQFVMVHELSRDQIEHSLGHLAVAQ